MSPSSCPGLLSHGVRPAPRSRDAYKVIPNSVLVMNVVKTLYELACTPARIDAKSIITKQSTAFINIRVCGENNKLFTFLFNPFMSRLLVHTVSHIWKCLENKAMFNPFALRVALESIVCYYHTFEKDLEIKQKFMKYLM